MPQRRWIKLSLFLALIPAEGFASPDFPAPELHENSLALKNTATSASYNREHKQADWVFYPLGENELEACVDRGNAFHPDPRLDRGDAAELADYKGSGFDRGHLSPAGDNRWSQAAMDESFLLTNVSPQPAAFNRGIWSRLESLVRAWAKDKSLWVTTGPVLSGTLKTIGDDKVSVPEYFYKVLATQEGDKHDAVAFVLPNDATGDFSQYEMTVSKLEDISGLHFLSGLSDEDEAKSSIDPALWNLHATFSYVPCKSVKPGTLDWAWGLSPPL